MQPMGRKKIRFPSKIDYHIHEKSVINWWEDVIQPSKKSERQKQKKEIKKELECNT